METQNESNTQPKIYAGKLCIAASICLLVGISLFFLLELSNEDVSLSFAILGLVVPFLGLLAIGNICSNWRSVTNPDDGSKSKDLIIKIADRFEWHEDKQFSL